MESTNILHSTLLFPLEKLPNKGIVGSFHFFPFRYSPNVPIQQVLNNVTTKCNAIENS